MHGGSPVNRGMNPVGLGFTARGDPITGDGALGGELISAFDATVSPRPSIWHRTEGREGSQEIELKRELE